jgi:hypothetical protein
MGWVKSIQLVQPPTSLRDYQRGVIAASGDSLALFLLSAALLVIIRFILIRIRSLLGFHRRRLRRRLRGCLRRRRLSLRSLRSLRSRLRRRRLRGLDLAEELVERAPGGDERSVRGLAQRVTRRLVAIRHERLLAAVGEERAEEPGLRAGCSGAG